MLKIFTFLLSGLGTGLLLSVPIGPANLLCLERSLKLGRFAGFITGAGATFGDFIFVIATLMGLLAVGDIQSLQTNNAKYLGAGILLIFALLGIIKGISQYHHQDASQPLRLLLSEQKNTVSKKQPLAILSGFLTSFILTVTNPLTPIGVITSVIAVGLGGGLFRDNLFLSVIIFAFGILLGSLGWWFTVATISHQFANKLTQRSLACVNYMGSIFMVGMAIYIMFFNI